MKFFRKNFTHFLCHSLHACLLAFCMVLIFVGVNGSAQETEITGESRIEASIRPIPCTLVDAIDLDARCERTILTWDIETLINVSLVSESMSLTNDLAVGIAGLEHALLNWDATIGDIDLMSMLWFATPFESVTDANNRRNTVVIPPAELRFVTFRLETVIRNSGLQFNNLAMFEDVTFPDPGRDYGTADCDGDGNVEGTCVDGGQTNPADKYTTSSFAFGNVASLFGQTSAGVLVRTNLGVCAERGSVSVKKASARNSVNPACAGGVKPDLLFDFINFSVSGIPISPDITGRASVDCQKINECSLTSNLNISGGTPIPLSTSFTIEDLFELRFRNSFRLRADSGPVTVTISFSNFEYRSIRLNFREAFNFGIFNASLSGSTSISRGTGITRANVNFSVSSGSFSADHSLSLMRNPNDDGLRFGSLRVRMGVDMDPGNFSLQATFGQSGLTEAVFQLGLQF